MTTSDPAWLRSQAKRCRSLAASTLDQQTAATLKGMADEYVSRAANGERVAERLRAGDTSGA